jgi:hypothetical protein
MPYTVDFNTVSTVGLESSPAAAALAGLRANEARYFKNKYDHVFTVEPASNDKTTIDWVHRILKEERDIVISSRPLEAGFKLSEGMDVPRKRLLCRIPLDGRVPHPTTLMKLTSRLTSQPAPGHLRRHSHFSGRRS